MRSLIHRLQSRLSKHEGEATDEHLLGDFLAHREGVRGAPQIADEAFAAIVRRHGPMVRGVCRRVLRNDTDADDAFQAVFIVLLRKAEAVRPRNRLGNWLYGVAVNVARRGRDASSRRRVQELTVEVPGPEPVSNDLREVIDQELSGLPDTYRAAVVVCDLEGHTRSEAAGRLGWSEGTVASRLARGRSLLADRLTRRGIVLPATGLVAALGANHASAVPILSYSALLLAPSPSAEALAQEVIRAMMSSKLRTVTVALLTVIGIAGTGTATVWACGGFGPRIVPPVSGTKSFPFESVETRLAQSNDATPSWAQSAPASTAIAGADKPAGENAGAAKSARFVLVNPAGDITVVSDRHETFVEFFRRQPVVVAVASDSLRKRLIYGEKGPLEIMTVDQASFNTGGPRVAAYGASLKLVPVSPNTPVARLLEVTSANEPVVFVQDSSDKNLWQAVGFTRRSLVGFFASTARVKPDDFAPADLLHATEKK
ncbi:ECF RNA polymerase sigma factor SigE [Gemmata sp. SH-PL17]|uniref:RNA polymerase sigma factor n=1 Tax=Gemmata sp. SH-PL17 TaxID=1630693 RepID=UPI00078EBF93|nr:sigma-70 family RNA polymerase sigma factor [Gemmata sp. SH-PL17]AMV29261.1 ECF RNA polymerase sigma factor SigE [Gemmata sp. SH-PL17]